MLFGGVVWCCAGETEGPCTMAVLKGHFEAKSIHLETNVWCEEIDAWREIGTIDSVTAHLQ